MIQKVYENIYLNSVRLPNTPLKSLNSYIITDANRALIIDSGFNTQISSEDFFSGIKELGIDIKNTDLFLTHLHADHSGLASIGSSMVSTSCSCPVERPLIFSPAASRRAM